MPPPAAATAARRRRRPQVDSAEVREASRPPPAWQQWLGQGLEQLKYTYFNWRQDTLSDLQLFLGFNVVVFLAGALFEVGGQLCTSPLVLRQLSTLQPPQAAAHGKQTLSFCRRVRLFERWTTRCRRRRLVLARCTLCKRIGPLCMPMAVIPTQLHVGGRPCLLPDTLLHPLPCLPCRWHNLYTVLAVVLG